MSLLRTWTSLIPLRRPDLVCTPSACPTGSDLEPAPSAGYLFAHGRVTCNDPAFRCRFAVVVKRARTNPFRVPRPWSALELEPRSQHGVISWRAVVDVLIALHGPPHGKLGRIMPLERLPPKLAWCPPVPCPQLLTYAGEVTILLLRYSLLGHAAS